MGNFLLADGRRFEAQVAALDLGDRQSRRNVAGQEISSYMVYIPPQGSKEGADRKAGELKQLGVTNYFIMNESSPLRWGISLGVFKSETQRAKPAGIAQQTGRAQRPRRAPLQRQQAIRLPVPRPRRGHAHAAGRDHAQFEEQELRSCK